MSESVGLKELLRRKIKENSDEVDKRRSVRANADDYSSGPVYHLSSDAPQNGRKDDREKPLAGVLLDFSRALEAVVDVGTYGAKKYARGNWQFVPNGFERYTDAMLRHLLAEQQVDGYDEESECLHAAHVAWNALARLEILLRRNATL